MSECPTPPTLPQTHTCILLSPLLFSPGDWLVYELIILKRAKEFFFLSHGGELASPPAAFLSHWLARLPGREEELAEEGKVTNNRGECLAWRAISLLSLRQVLVWTERVCGCACARVCRHVLEPCARASTSSASPEALGVGQCSEVLPSSCSQTQVQRALCNSFFKSCSVNVLGFANARALLG